MMELGFHEDGRYFKHPESQFFVEFPPGPLSIGEELVNQIVEKKLSTGTLKIISPTDCVKDRLAAYYHWGDQQSLVQATWWRNNTRSNLMKFEDGHLQKGNLMNLKE